MGIIADLYNGKVYPFENISYSNHKGYKELLIKLEKLETSFLATLSSEDVQVYETLRNIQTDKECIELEQTFVYAFRLGALLQTDIYVK